MGETHRVPRSAPIAPYASGDRVAHVGPHKTGTTVVQGALHAARERLAEHGVWLPSPARNPVEEVRDGVRRRPQDPERPAWHRLTDAVARTGERIAVVSSEFFADAEPEACRRIVTDLGGPRTRILITLRPLAKILPSQWQQHVQSGMHTRYEDWLAGLVKQEASDRQAETFWQRHRHDAFVRRWAAAAGADHVTVLLVDESEPDRVLRDFEALLGVPAGTLQAVRNSANRSLTAGEAEAVRQCAEFCHRRGWSKAEFSAYVRYGVVPRIKTGRRPAPGEARIATPAWALDWAAQTGAAMAERIAATGVRVIGDLEALRGDGIAPAEPSEAGIPPEVAALAVLGCMSVAVRDRARREPDPPSRSGGGSLLRIVAQRARGRLRAARGRS